MVLALALALALNQKLRGVTLYRAIYFLPVVTSAVAVSIVWRWLYNPEFGLFNVLLSFIGLPPIRWSESLQVGDAIGDHHEHLALAGLQHGDLSCRTAGYRRAIL